MNIKVKLASAFRCTLTRISPMLNTKVTYAVKFKRKLDLDNPVTLNDKILWLKFNTYWNNPVIKQCADKLRVRDYIASIGCHELLNELIAAYKHVEDIDWDALPQQFALKLNVGCGCNIIATDKSKLDIQETKKVLKKWMKQQYYLEHSEMQYKDVEKFILVEKYLGSKTGNLPEDYKFYCMNGKAKYVMLCADREAGKSAQYFYYDRDWNKMQYSLSALENPSFEMQKPQNIELAFEYAEKLSKDFPFVRVDLYIVDGKVYFGELTFTPSAGMDVTRLASTDKLLGEQLILNHKKENES